MSLISTMRRRRDDGLPRVRAWAREIWKADEETTVMVTEIACDDPGCPPHETVVVIARTGAPTTHHSIPRPAADVTRADLETRYAQENTTA